jgi:hypothetical protein
MQRYSENNTGAVITGIPSITGIPGITSIPGIPGNHSNLNI